MSKTIDFDVRDEFNATMTLKLKDERSFRAGVTVFTLCKGALVDVQQVDHRNRKYLINFGDGLVDWVSKAVVDQDFELASDLTIGNIDEAEFNRDIDPVDTLRRIGKEWLGLKQTCQCDANSGCPICEITYLLNEAFMVER
jgi:hypothetical protein